MVKTQTPVNEPCPFCGDAKAAVDTLNSTSGNPIKFRVQCRDCHAATRWCNTEEQAMAAWKIRHVTMCNELTAFVINSDMFIYKARMYMRNKQSGYCFAQKTFRGPLKRIKKSDFLSAAQSAATAQAEQVNTGYEQTTGKVKV